MRVCSFSPGAAGLNSAVSTPLPITSTGTESPKEARVPAAMNSSMGTTTAAPRSTIRANEPSTTVCTSRTTNEEWCTNPTCRCTTYGVRSSRHQKAATQLVR